MAISLDELTQLKEQANQQRREANQIRLDAIAAGTWGKQQNYEYHAPVVTVPEEKKTAADKLWDRGAQPLSATTQAKMKANSAKKKLEDYQASDEYKQAAEERYKQAEQKQKEQNVVNLFMGKDPSFSAVQPEADPVETRLKAEYDHAQAEADALANEEVMVSDLEAITGLSNEDRRMLEQYAVGRDVDFYDSLNMAQNGFQIGRAEQNAAPLIEKYGKEQVDKWANSWMRNKNQETAQEVAAAGQQHANDHPVLSSVASIGANIAGSIGGTLASIKDLGRHDDRYTTLSPDNEGNIFSAYGGAVRGQVAQNIEGEDPTLLRKGLSIGYQGVMFVADAIARAYLGGGAFGGAALAATGSFSQTMADASRQGATPAQAALLATANAGIEALSEKIPLDDLIEVAKGTGAKNVIYNVLRQMGIEATTEEVSLIGTMLTEAAVLKEKSGYNQTVTTQLLMGKSLEEARKAAAEEIWDEAVNTALVSAVSGIGGGVSASVYAARNAAPELDTASPNLSAEQMAQEAIANNRARHDAMAAEEATQPVQQPETAAQPQQPTPETQQAPTQPKTAQEVVDEILTGNQNNATQNAQQTAQDKQKEIVDLFVNPNKADATNETNAISNPIDSYPPEKQKSIRSYLQSVDQGIKDFVQRVKSGDKTFKRQKISDVNDRAAQDIGKLLGVDAHGYTHNINTGGVQHIINRHGTNGEHDNTMSSDDDIARVGWVLENYDNVELVTENGKQVFSKEFKDANNNPAPQIRFVKKIDGSYYVVEAACENKYKKLWVQSAYLQKNNGDVTQVSTADPSASHATNAQSELASPSPITSISESKAEVNGNPANIESTPTTDTQNQSAEGGQIKGTGAAEQNFSGKPSYNATLSEDNAQPDRKTDVRPMELPATDVNGGNVSATTANVYGSQNTPDDLAAAMEEPVARGDYSYVRITNDAATERARQEIGRAGDWETARANFGKDVEQGIAGAEISARGALILNHATEVYQQAKDSGDPQAAADAKKEWLGVLSDVQKLGTNTAQGLQALRIIRNLAPQDKIQFAQIAVKNMVRDMRLNTDIQIDEQLLTEYEAATTDQQRDEIIERIQQNVADQIPSTMLDKWNALRYTNMLGNLKANVRNVAGNVANTAVYRFKDSVGAAIEAIVNKASGGKTGRTKSVIVNKHLQKAMEPYYQQVKNAIGSGGKYADNASASSDFAQGVMDKRRIFKSNAKNETVRKIGDAVLAPMEGYRKATNWMMNNEYFGDEAFGKAAFTHSLAGYLQANGIRNAADVKNASPDLMDRAIAYAVKEAQETTFHDNSALANVLGRLKKDAGIIGEGLLPFTKTPANVLTRAEEYSPLGILNTAILSAQKVAGNTKLADANGRLGSWAARGQDITGTDIINSLSKTLTGAGIFALGAILKNNGILNGGPDDDEEQAAFDKMNGIQPYSINLPNGTTYTLDWLTPVAMPLFMGAQLMQIAGEKDLTFADLEEVFTSLADPMIQMSMMQGINSSLEDIKYSGNNMGQFFLNAAVKYLTQGLTNTLLGQIERSTEEYRQTTFINPDSNTPQWAQKALGKASQKIPGWDYQQTEYLDAWGEPQKNEGGLLYNLLSPGYVNKRKEDGLTKELARLRSATGESVFPESVSKTITYTDKDGTLHKDQNLTAEEWSTLQKTQGQTAKKIIFDLINSKDYKALSDEQKAEAIKLAYSYARETGEQAAFEDSLGYSESWMMDMSGKSDKAGYILNKVGTAMLSGAMGKLDVAWDNKYNATNQSALSDQLAKEFEAYSKMKAASKQEVYDSLTGTAKKYVEAREKGVSHDDFLKAAKGINDVKGTGKYDPDTGKNAVRDIDRRTVIADMPGLSDSARDTLMRAYMTDYNPDAETVYKTEPKYDFIRQEMGLSASEYADSYRAYLDLSGKYNEIHGIMDAIGCDYGTASKLRNLYGGWYKGADWNKFLDMYVSK